jgi:hypothetical protein
MPIKIYQWQKSDENPSDSYFCMKLESYVKAMSINYETEITFDIRVSPTGMFHFMEYNNQILKDSSSAITYLESKVTTPMQISLNKSQISESWALIRLIEDHLYIIALYSRWLDRSTYNDWEKRIKKYLSIPNFLSSIMLRSMRKNIQKKVDSHNVGIYSISELYELGCKDISILSDYLSNKRFFYENKPTLLDHCVYSIVASILHMPWDYQLKDHLLSKNNLILHYKVMMGYFFPNYEVHLL